MVLSFRKEAEARAEFEAQQAAVEALEDALLAKQRKTLVAVLGYKRMNADRLVAGWRREIKRWQVYALLDESEGYQFQSQGQDTANQPPSYAEEMKQQFASSTIVVKSFDTVTGRKAARNETSIRVGSTTAERGNKPRTSDTVAEDEPLVRTPSYRGLQVQCYPMPP